MRVSTWGNPSIEYDNKHHVIVSIVFDYLIIPKLTLDYDYCRDLLHHEERKRLLFISRCTYELSQDLSRRIQVLEAPQNKYLTMNFFTLNWCWFARQPKYFFTADAGDWSSHRWRLDKSNLFVHRVKISKYYKESNRLFIQAKAKEFMEKRKQCFHLIESSFKMGKLKDYYDFECQLYTKRTHSIRRTMSISMDDHCTNESFLRAYSIRRIIVEQKFHVLCELLSRRRICNYPLCTTLCFAPRTTCVYHEYYDCLVEGRIIKPSTWTLIKLEKSMCTV